MTKTLIGPQLRQIRQRSGHTQAEMAKRLGISPAYVNLLENNQRSLSVSVLLGLAEHYGVDMKSLVQDSDTAQLADLRAAARNPIFTGDRPDLPQLRAALTPRFDCTIISTLGNSRATISLLASVEPSSTRMISSTLEV